MLPHGVRPEDQGLMVKINAKESQSKTRVAVDGVNKSVE